MLSGVETFLGASSETASRASSQKLKRQNMANPDDGASAAAVVTAELPAAPADPYLSNTSRSEWLRRRLEAAGARLPPPTDPQQELTEQHFVVFQNGFNGAAGDWLRFLPDAALLTSDLRVIVSAVNEGFRATHDGLLASGRRLADLLLTSVPEGASLSLAGHGVGGLILRSALLQLGEATLVRWNLRLFCTFATPHLGVVPRLGFTSPLFRVLWFVSVADILQIARDVSNKKTNAHGFFGVTERAILAAFDRRVVMGATPWFDDDAVPVWTSLMLDPTTATSVPPEAPVGDGEPWRITSPGDYMPNPNGDDDVLQFTQALLWERYMVAIPSLQAHKGIISHGPHVAPAVTRLFWTDLIGIPLHVA